MSIDLDIQPLTRQRLPDLAALFGQGGDPKWSWCASFRVRAVTFYHASPTANRAVLERAVDELSAGLPPAESVIGGMGYGAYESTTSIRMRLLIRPFDS